MILPCTCKHKFQDEEYGEGNRVHNYAPGGGGGATAGKKPGYRCTVCLKMKPVPPQSRGSQAT